jgi:apolipoprotein D and lipocalin family protein
MKTCFLYFTIIMTLTNFAGAQDTVSAVDLNKYAGKWYLIACIPSSVDKRWNYVTETYTIKANGKIDIYTTYIKENKPGSKKAPKQKHIRSKGIPQKGTNNFKWKVRFLWLFGVDYLIEEVPEDYSYTVVGHPEKKFLYIMSREKTIDEGVYNDIVKRCKDKGYPMFKLVKVPQ